MSPDPDAPHSRPVERLLTLAAVLVLSLTALAGCRGAPKSTAVTTAVPSGPIVCDQAVYGDLDRVNPTGQVVVYWHPFTGSQEELLLSLIDRFNRTNKWRVVVLPESYGGYDRLHQGILKGLADSRVPDLTTVYPYQATIYALQGRLVALDCYVDSPRWGYSRLERADFFPFTVAAGDTPQLAGRYGWPFFRSVDVLYYNRDWLTELGYTEPPKTWDEFATMACEAAQQPFSGAKGEGPSLGYEYDFEAQHFATLVFSRGGSVFDSRSGAYTFGGQEGLDVLASLQDLNQRGCAAVTAERYRDLEDFGAGWVLFTLSPLNHLPRYEKAIAEGADFDWSIEPPPYGGSRSAPQMNLYGPSQSIFTSDPAKQLAAWLFIRWLSEPQQQSEWIAGTGYYPTRRRALVLLGDYMTQHPAYAKARDFTTLEHSTEPSVPGYDQCRGVIEEMLRAVADGAFPQARLDGAVLRCTRFLSQPAP